MNDVNKILNKYACNPYRYTIKNGVTIVDTDDGHFVFKRKNRDKKSGNVNDLYKYLKSRNFEYYPKLVSSDEDYDVYEYIEDIDTPREQKAEDIMHLISLLHNKTTYYKEMDIDEYKEIYESINHQVEYMYNYYTDIITSIEKNVYMSPHEYLLARNISKIYASLYFCKEKADDWYEMIKAKSKKRMATIHNNLDIDHVIRNEGAYLLSWDKAKQDIPIYDLYYFYKRNALDYDFEELIKIYESKYPLLEEERLLFFILISIPDKLELDGTEYENTSKVRRLLDYIYKSEMLLTPYYSEQNKEEESNFQE